MAQVKVQTRENAAGNYWCNATVNRLDISVEGATIDEARSRFKNRTGLTEGDVEWLPVKPYPHQEKIKIPAHTIRCQRVRIDHNPIA